MDWKPERAIQAKVRDFQNKIKQKNMIAEACQWRNILRWSTNGNFFQTLGQQWALFQKRHQLLPCDGFCPVNGSICSKSHYLQGSLPSVCTAMTVHLPSYLLCLVSLSLFVIYNSYSHTNYIHTLILSHIHTHQIHNINSYMVASVTQSHV